MGLERIKTEMKGDTSRHMTRVEAKTSAKKRRRRADVKLARANQAER